MATPPTCCICGETLERPTIIGGRAYCERHAAVLNRPHPSFWRTTLVQIAGMAIFAAVVAGLASLLPPPQGPALIAAGLLLAIIPTALWLLYFYRQDRLEPEPKTRIAGVFLLALLLTQAIGFPLIYDWFGLGRLTATSPLLSLTSYVLVMGFTLQAINYAAVRLVVYATEEFDERMDGIVYGTVAGLGVATLLNLRYIIANEGVALAPGVIQVSTVALAQASFGGLLGYVMAQARFEHRPAWWVPLGLTGAALLNGLFNWLKDEVSTVGLTVEPWRSLVFSLLVALAVFGLLLYLMRRSAGAVVAGSAAGRGG